MTFDSDDMLMTMTMSVTFVFRLMCIKLQTIPFLVNDVLIGCCSFFFSSFG